jgi:hypothetical protein
MIRFWPESFVKLNFGAIFLVFDCRLIKLWMSATLGTGFALVKRDLTEVGLGLSAEKSLIRSWIK